MAGARDINHVEIVFLNQPVEMDTDKTLAWIGAPMADQTLLDVVELQRLPQQRITRKVEHPQREIVAGPPVSVDFPKLAVRDGRFVKGQFWRCRPAEILVHI